ncbi:MAG: TIGR01244 family phosphatase [Alphaproteobacteria bacterium]|nr:MAG: TIGR01244 family phosphatase [Alphaproteobacteria bacterium]
MDIRQLDQGMAVAPQIALPDVAELAKAGFRAVICNRPDGEEPGQPAFAEIAQAAQAAGMAAHHIPIASGQLDLAAAERFARVLDETDGPVFAYCRSGTRSAMLWALSQAGRRPMGEILAATASAGYDLSPLAQLLGGLTRPAATG